MTNTYKTQELYIILKDVTVDDLEKLTAKNPTLLVSIWNNRAFWEFKANIKYNISKQQFNKISKLHLFNPRETYAYLETENGVLNKLSHMFIDEYEFTSLLVHEQDREHMIELLTLSLDNIDWEVLADYIVKHEDFEVLDIVKNIIRFPDIRAGLDFIFFLIKHKRIDILLHLDKTGDLSLNTLFIFVNVDNQEELKLVREIVKKAPKSYPWEMDELAIRSFHNVDILREVIDIFPENVVPLDFLIEQSKPFKESWLYLKSLRAKQLEKKKYLILLNN